MRALQGQAIRAERRGRVECARLRTLLRRAKAQGDLETWRRAKAVLGYLSGERVMAMAEQLDVARASINRWLQWFDAEGTAGLKPRKAPGAPSRLSDAQRAELAATIEGGPVSAGYLCGLWTGPMIGELIQRRYGVKYHHQHVPRLLHALGFSVQRPRKRLCRADEERQAMWVRDTFPAIKKERPPAVA